MEKRKSLFTLFLISIVSCFSLSQLLAQSISTKTHKIAIFAPLYLDSAFDATETYRYGKAFPKFINPGLEFYEGVELALDSLKKESQPLEVYVFDTKAANTSIKEQLNSPEIHDIELIIAHTTLPEMKIFAEAAMNKKIPFINVNLPNDGGINGNPFVVLLNSTLKTHCEGLYRYIQKYYSLDPVIFFRKKGFQEEQIKNYFEEFGKATASVPLKIKYVDLEENFVPRDLTRHLDSNHHIICIAGSMDSNFGKTLAQQLASINSSYPLTVMGMPTWDGLKDFNKPEYKGLEVIYSTPFYNPRTDKVSLDILNYFNTRMYARPSDMVFRGYEATWRFTKLLTQYTDDLSSNLTRKQYNIFRDFDIQPVFLNKQNMILDYFENKKLYFIKMVDGIVVSVL